MSIIKRLFFDVETTHTEWTKGGIHQISGIIDFDGKEERRFNIKMQPHPSAIILDKAIAISGVTREQIASYPTQAEGFKMFLEHLGECVDKFESNDKMTLIGFRNSSFDNFWLRQLFEQVGDKYFGAWFYQNTVDVATLASEYFIDKRHEIENYKLATVAKYFGIPIDESRLHDALYDVELTRMTYYMLKEQGKQDFESYFKNKLKTS